MTTSVTSATCAIRLTPIPEVPVGPPVARVGRADDDTRAGTRLKTSAWAVSTWLHEREEDRFPDPGIGKQHHQPVDAQTKTAHRWCPELQRRQEILVQLHRLRIARGGGEGLYGQPLPLNDRIDELREARRAFQATDQQVPGFDQVRVTAVRAGQRLGQRWIVTDEGRLDQGRLDQLAEQMENQLLGGPALLGADSVPLGDLAQVLRTGVRCDLFTEVP